MYKSLNEVYEKNQLFYWHNACGEIHMPGDGEGYYPHDPDELPAKCRQLYDRFFSEDHECYCYVANYEGKTGLLLVAPYDEEYCCREVCGFNTTVKAYCSAAMTLAFLVLKNRAANMERSPEFAKCSILLGEYTDPVAHELALFIPEEETEQADEIRAAFLQHSWNKDDEAMLKALMKTMYQEG